MRINKKTTTSVVMKFVVSEALLKFSYVTNTFVSNKMLIVFAKKKKKMLIVYFPFSLQVSFLFFFFFHQSNRVNKRKIKLLLLLYTNETDSSAATARISAQETVAGQALSNAVFMSSTTPKPLAELLFGGASFSLSMVAELFNKIDASQPCNKVDMLLHNLKLEAH
jgi:hypothetical protein